MTDANTEMTSPLSDRRLNVIVGAITALFDALQGMNKAAGRPLSQSMVNMFEHKANFAKGALARGEAGNPFDHRAVEEAFLRQGACMPTVTDWAAEAASEAGTVNTIFRDMVATILDNGNQGPDDEVIDALAVLRAMEGLRTAIGEPDAEMPQISVNAMRGIGALQVEELRIRNDAQTNRKTALQAAGIRATPN